MGEDVERADPPDVGISEYWRRWPDDGKEADIRGVLAYSQIPPGSYQWKVIVEAGEYCRDGVPLGTELRDRIEGTLRAVPGVTGLHRQDWPEWLVYGAASGEALCRAAVDVVDDMADRLRAAYGDDEYW